MSLPTHLKIVHEDSIRHAYARHRIWKHQFSNHIVNNFQINSLVSISLQPIDYSFLIWTRGTPTPMIAHHWLKLVQLESTIATVAMGTEGGS